jgi:hypothetical protein
MQQPVGKRRLPMIDMGDNTKVSYVRCVHLPKTTKPFPGNSSREGESTPFAVKHLSVLAGMTSYRSQQDNGIPPEEKENCQALACAVAFKHCSRGLPRRL